MLSPRQLIRQLLIPYEKLFLVAGSMCHTGICVQMVGIVALTKHSNYEVVFFLMLPFSVITRLKAILLFKP